MHIGRDRRESHSYPWIGRSISVKNNTADTKVYFLHPVRGAH